MLNVSYAKAARLPASGFNYLAVYYGPPVVRFVIDSTTKEEYALLCERAYDNPSVVNIIGGDADEFIKLMETVSNKAIFDYKVPDDLFVVHPHLVARFNVYTACIRNVRSDIPARTQQNYPERAIKL